MDALPPSLAGLPDRLLPTADPPSAAAQSSRQAAVLVLLYPRAGDIRFPLTVRPGHLARHAGQIALPGGLVESVDQTLWDAALRETYEEVGVDPRHIRPLGRLATHHLTVSDYLITPFVGWIDAEPVMIPDPAEVAEVFDVSLTQILEPESVEQEEWLFRERRWRVTFYRLDGKVVWGATARILHEFVSRLQNQSPEPADTPGSVTPVE
jgi:8-oxo-dGTP pyrophosphatase MutT (NUDIX family)